MSFCPECDSMLIWNAEDKYFTCPDCEYSEQNENALNNMIISEKIEHTEKSKIEIIDNVDASGAIDPEFREELREQYREAMSSI